VKRLIIVPFLFAGSLGGCHYESPCLQASRLTRSLLLREESGPLVLSEPISSGAVPELHASTLRVDTNTTTEDFVGLIMNDGGSFSLPQEHTEDVRLARVVAPQADSCAHQYPVEITLTLVLPEDWPAELQDDFPPQQLSYDEGAWPTGEAVPTVCFGDWCVEVSFSG
jgi:hypothetical protein